MTAFYLFEQVQGVVDESEEFDDDHSFVVFCEIILTYGEDVVTQSSTQQQTVKELVVQWSTPSIIEENLRGRGRGRLLIGQ